MKEKLKKKFTKKDLFKLKAALLYFMFLGTSSLFYSSEETEKLERKSYLKTKTVIDKDGIVSTDEQYDDFESTKSYITVYSKWDHDDYDKYERTITKYEINDLPLSDISRLLNEDLNNIETILGKPIDKCEEESCLVSEDEYKKGTYIEAVIIDESKFEYKSDLKPLKEVFVDDGLFITCMLLIGGLIQYGQVFYMMVVF